ncbi:hypothetical protein PR003_g13108 [Phytophthora rubi]|uniref:RxLR effector protein n=1 Tax=Phytophthora rubi TaxID=129364 RepID=A0A6A4EYD4_9STRA|nr:hypothetical protein PR003_g13108 [Phytophthora rubi]
MVYSNQVFAASVLSLFALNAGVNGKLHASQVRKKHRSTADEPEYCHLFTFA